jgi:uncharacterized repeat protein (TIGR03803 family)
MPPRKHGHPRRVGDRSATSARIGALVTVAMFVLVSMLPAAAFAQYRYELVQAFDEEPSGNVVTPVIQARDGSFYGTRSNQVFRVDADGTLTVLHRFRGAEGTNPSAFIQARDGHFYGTTSSGGALGAEPAYGTVFRMDAAGNVVVLHRFSGPDGATPVAALLEANDGSFYGTTSRGGASFDATTAGDGTVFKIDASGAFTTLHSFEGICFGICSLTGSNPRTALIQARDGVFYGTTRGSSDRSTIFRMDPTGVVTNVVMLARRYASGPLVEARDGTLYGTSLSTDGGLNGTVFNIDSAGTLTSLHYFQNAEGAYPSGGLVQGADDSFYGITQASGPLPPANGTVFRIDPAGTVTTLHQFTGPDGTAPSGPLFPGQDGRFYGTTSRGGPDTSSSGGYGTLFGIDAAGTLTTVHAFVNTPGGGSQPHSSVVEAADGTLYGMTTRGGLGGGTVYTIDAGVLATLYSFPLSPRTSGTLPEGGLTPAANGQLYGVTGNFGAYGYGTAFTIDASGALTTIHQFTAEENAPRLGLIQAADGDFYGTTVTSTFRMTAAGEVTILHTFPITGILPAPQGLVQAPGGSFYGTTTSDGPKGYGSIFTMDPTGVVTILHSFTGPDGAYPMGRLMQGADGSLYGVTLRGGASFGDSVAPEGYGTIFKFDAAGTFTILHHFTGGDGSYPDGGLMQSRGGSFFGTTAYGGSGYGTIFRMDAAGTLTTLYRFARWDGAVPSGELFETSDGSIYGSFQFYGPGGGGGLFRLVPTFPPTGPFGGAAHAAPGRIEAEDYDLGGQGVGYFDTTPGNEQGDSFYRADDVDIKTSSEGGYAVGWLAAGEWLAYTVNVTRDGAYTIQAHVGTTLPGRTFHVEVDGLDVTGPMAAPQVAEWDHYETVGVPNVRLRSGVHVIRVVMGPEDFMDLEWIAFVPSHARRPPRDRGHVRRPR